MKLKKMTALMLSAAMITGMLAGCGGSKSESTGSDSAATEDSASADGKVNLKFYIWSDEENYMKEVAENYNKSQDKVSVEVISIANDSYDDKLKVMLSAGSDADIVDIRTLNQVQQFKASGAILDLTDKVKDSDLDISKYGSMWDAQYPDGEIYALPTRSTCWMLFYNEDILKEAGITMPEQMTWDEYADMAKELTTDDRFGGEWINWDIYHALATQKGVYLNSDDVSAVQESLEFINRLMNVDKSHVSLAELQATDAQYLADFENGKVAMMPQGEWLINMLNTDIKDGKTNINWNVAPMPVPDGVEAGTTWGQCQFAGIPKDAKHQEESFDFLKYLCGEDGSSVLPKYGMLPAYSGDEAKEAFREVVGKDNIVDVAFNAKKVLETLPYEKYSELLTALKENAELYLLGEKDIDEIMSNFEKQRQEIMNEE